jgi:PAS domain S-box-containing protein
MRIPQPLRLLSVEDDPKDAELIQGLLESEGIVCEVTRVDTQAALLASLEQGEIDLVLADHTLPSFDGISALKFAVKARPEVPFIFVSGTLGEEVAIEALKLGATDYVLKTRLSRLVPSVRRALREATERAERKKAEESLRQSEAYLAEAQHLSHTGSFGWKPSTGEIIWSEETFRIFQYELTTTPTLELILQRVHPDDAALVEQTVERASQQGKDFEHEYRLLMPDASVKHVHVVARAFSDESGSTEFVGAVMDVSAARQVEQTLQESKAYLAEAQRLTHTGSWARVAATGEIRYWSEECYRVLGFEPHDGLPAFETFLEHVHPEDRGKVRERAETAERQKVQYEVDYRIVHPGGEIRDVHVIGHPILKPSGKVVEFVGTVMDVTDRMRAEGALRRSEAYLAEAQKLSHTGSWAWIPATGEIRYFSEECYRLLGFDPHGEQPRYETLLRHIHPDDQAKFRETVDAATRRKVDYEMDYRIVQLGGESRDIHVIGHPVLSPSGDLVEFVGTVIDVTERKRTEEERERLRQALEDLAHINRVNMMGELTASLAHELNQPIAAATTDASTCLRWLSRDQPDLEEARAAASRVVNDAARAAELMTRVRSLFKKEGLQRELVDVNDIIREIIDLLRSEATRHSISMRTELSEDLPQIMADRVQLQQVTLNLIINSIDAMKGLDGTREIAITSQRAENEQLQVSVSDTGIGLPAQQADQIFNAFFTTKHHGTGMGLRISRSIIESHGGRLWASDNSPRGASFSFTLPTEIEEHA